MLEFDILSSATEAKTTTNVFSTDNPIYTPGEVGSHVPPHTNTGSTEHDFDNPLYDVEEGPTNEYSSPWGTHNYTITKQPTYANRQPGTLPPGVGEHYEMMPTANGADPTDHYEFEVNQL